MNIPTMIKAICLGLVLGLGASPSRADFIVDHAVTEEGGLYTYAYTIRNETDSEIFTLEISDIVGLESFGEPEGWPGIFTTVFDRPTMIWQATNLDLTGLPPSGTLGGFTITSRHLPGEVRYSALDGDDNVFSGNTIGPAVPAAVPEPSSLALAGLGALGLLGYGWRRRRRRAV